MTFLLLAYIDPGILAIAIQGLFAFLFAVLTGYVLGPWRWIKSFFVRNEEEAALDEAASVSSVDDPGSDVTA